MVIETKKVAVIGGSGVRDSPMFNGLEWKKFETGILNGFGDGVVEYQEEAGAIFIPRHGKYPRVCGPSKTQYAANLAAAARLGANVVIATSAVGSYKPQIPLESLVVPGDYIDETGRDDNIFGAGIVVHVNPRPAFSEELRQILINEAMKGGYFGNIRKFATYVAIPGDRFGTTAEGAKRKRYADIVGMTACPEASMAMQLGLHYAVAAFVVDNDDNANHEHQTMGIMSRLSSQERVPAYITAVVEKAKQFAQKAGKLKQLEGNIIAADLSLIQNKHLRQIAEELRDTYR